MSEREIRRVREERILAIDAGAAGAENAWFDARFRGKGEEKIKVTTGETPEDQDGVEKEDWKRPVGARRGAESISSSILQRASATGSARSSAFQREADDGTGERSG